MQLLWVLEFLLHLVDQLHLEYLELRWLRSVHLLHQFHFDLLDRLYPETLWLLVDQLHLEYPELQLLHLVNLLHQYRFDLLGQLNQFYLGHLLLIWLQLYPVYLVNLLLLVDL